LHDFGIFLELEPDTEEKAQLEQNIQIALQSGGIDLEDAIDVRQIKNLKLANQLLKQKRKKKYKRDQAAAQANIQMQAQANAKTNEQAALAEVQKQQALTEQQVNLENAKSQFEIQRMQVELEGKKHLKGDEKNTVNYLDMVNLYLTSLDKYMKKINDKDLKNKYTIMDDIEAFKKQYNGDYIKFSKSSSKKSNLFTEMKQNSCKMTAMIFNSFMSKGPLIFFSNYVKMEGLDILKLYLKFCGFSEFKNKSSGKDYFRYTEYHGSIDVIAREKNKENFNEKINIDGKLIKIILISPAGSEGISLSNVRQVHILDPYWNEVRIEQLIARAVRICSHEDLKMKDRIVDIFRYYAVKPKSITTDIDIRNLALKKKELIESFLLPVKEIAIDCELNKADNSIDKKKEYTCFKFDQTSLFNNTIGPAYKQDIYYDSKIDNGLNSINSQKIKIKVKEIFAVKKIENSDKYTEQMKFWLDEDNGIIYDYKHDFPIGKISFDEDDIPNMISQNVYIISHLVPIPKLDFYK